jgi:gas vesicle protein
MITNIDIKKLKTIFATKEDLKKEISGLRGEMQKMSKTIIEEIVNVVTALGEKIQESLDKLNDHEDSIENHERRIEKLEEKVFPPV